MMLGFTPKSSIFEVLAAAYSCPVVTTPESERSFSMNVHNREFTMAELHLAGRRAKGPRAQGASGMHLVTSTPLKASQWKRHSLSIHLGEWQDAAAGDMAHKLSGDAGFDSEFVVAESGGALPESWLDKQLRSDVRAVFQLPLRRTAVGVEDGVLSHYLPVKANALDARASQEMLRRLGWLAGGLDRAAAGERRPGNEDEEELDLAVVTETAAPPSASAIHYTLSKNMLSVGGDYSIKDATGTLCYRVDGKLRFAATFDLLDAQKTRLFSGREHVLGLAHQFSILRDGMPHAKLMRRVFRNAGNVFGAMKHAYDIECLNGEKFMASGMFTGHWKLTQGDTLIASMAIDGEVSDITMPAEPRDLPFVLAVIMAVVRLNPPSRYGESTD